MTAKQRKILWRFFSKDTTEWREWVFSFHFILFSIISKQFNTKSYKYWKDQEKEEAAQRQTLKHA